MFNAHPVLNLILGPWILTYTYSFFLVLDSFSAVYWFDLMQNNGSLFSNIWPQVYIVVSLCRFIRRILYHTFNKWSLFKSHRIFSNRTKITERPCVYIDCYTVGLGKHYSVSKYTRTPSILPMEIDLFDPDFIGLICAGLGQSRSDRSLLPSDWHGAGTAHAKAHHTA